jgi:acetyltransferase-like isoleucine patch superfamily enzyme
MRSLFKVFSIVPKVIKALLFYIHQWLDHFALQRRGIRLDRSTILKGKNQIYGNVKLGANTIIQNSHLDGRGGIDVGNNVIIDQATLITAQHNLDSKSYETIYSSITINDFAILYQHSIVLPGRRIGRGSVIAVGAIVTHDVPDMAIVAGNPARVIRYRKNLHSDCDLQMMGGYNLRAQSRKYLARKN